jgi:hypothetical protein
MITSLFLVLGAMTMTWICDTISESGFGNTLYHVYRNLGFGILASSLHALIILC